MQKNEILTVDEAAKRLGLKKKTIQNRIAAGRFPFRRRDGITVIFTEDLANYFKN